ncbi:MULTISPECIES: flagellar export chaperone FliS [unclassified Arsenophonus]|uniref:flagellar export chaperone FliS n=1 Tax=unclassified Arsenophonus TaxID=2627083 RepID=UPI00285DC53C|nr:flagellar export chaperone FliS [Arsenophonus sp.]MDR5610206.1 flagellar export chaperone FliS [Arsenophonus sp.]MDR5614017.1 flagellar export chaperone FliS [Arsenophonus sp.]
MNTSAAETLYTQVDIESQVLNASPYQLVQILFDGALSALKRAVIYIEQNNIRQKSRAISKAVAIINEGLNSGVDLKHGGEIAENISLLYDYMIRQLLYANLYNDVDRIQQVIKLLTDSAETWAQLNDPATQSNEQ